MNVAPSSAHPEQASSLSRCASKEAGDCKEDVRAGGSRACASTRAFLGRQERWLFLRRHARLAVPSFRAGTILIARRPALKWRYKREAVTVTFHYLIRQEKAEEGGVKFIPFTYDEFVELASTLQSLPPMDLAQEQVRDKLRFKNVVPIGKIELVNDRTIFGSYQAAYWGHAYDNTDVGKIPASSISLRPFYFLLYYSESGRIYIGVQYLGQFGSYTGLKKTIIRFLRGANIAAHSFRLGAAAFEAVEPKEVRVQISKKPEEIAGDNVFSEGAVIAFKRSSRGDAFGTQVKKRLFPFVGTTKDKIQKAAAGILKDSKLVDVDDEDIQDCSIIGEVDGRRTTIYMISQGLYASQFHLSVGFNEDGHPEPEPVKKEMLKLLEAKIISRKEDA